MKAHGFLTTPSTICPQTPGTWTHVILQPVSLTCLPPAVVFGHCCRKVPPRKKTDRSGLFPFFNMCNSTPPTSTATPVPCKASWIISASDVVHVVAASPTVAVSGNGVTFAAGKALIGFASAPSTMVTAARCGNVPDNTHVTLWPACARSVNLVRFPQSWALNWMRSPVTTDMAARDRTPTPPFAFGRLISTSTLVPSARTTLVRPL
mmetsp:Transcript_16087/g.43728  ORF Transcript_16087/g.43728 Transcript_16087/m.43728 type:complete len:207 (+) Transcript_16087:281-901(+)